MEQGNVVKLKSGGPEMTIKSIEDDYVRCEWINGRGDEMHGSFPSKELTLVK